MKAPWAAPVVGRWIVAAALLLVAAGPVLAQQGDNEYPKPLDEYTMENLVYAAFHDPRAATGTCIDCHKQKGSPAPMKCLECHKKK